MKNNIKTVFMKARNFTVVLALAFLTLCASAYAIELPETKHSEFLNEFVTGYRAGQTQYLTNTLRANKRNVASVINTLLEEAKKRDFEQRMELLDIANAMASMHKHWNYDDKPLKLVEAILKKEMAEANARAAAKAKWASYEKFPGNVLFRTNPAGLASAKVTPVIFPHWKHRLLYECSACHDSLFKIDRSSRNKKRPSLMHQPTRCGACHDSKTAFGITGPGADFKANCNRCHSAETEFEKAQLYTAGAEQNKALSKSAQKAEQIGGFFKPMQLENSTLPTDRFGSIDWVALKKSGAYRPVTAIKNVKADAVTTHSSTVLFTVPDSASWIGAAPFRHLSHTTGITCDTCHTSLYNKELKAEKIITMQDMAEGKSCGACHNKVAFKLADCMKCHTNSLTEIELKSILQREQIK